jgi:hypothetical protein
MSMFSDANHRFKQLALCSVAFGLAVTAPLLFSAGGASASNSPTSSLVVTGAMKGTLKLGPKSYCLAGSNGVTLSAFTTSLSSTKYKHWTIDITVAKLGTYTSFKSLENGGTSHFVLESGVDAWVATSGTMTIKADSGTANVVLAAHEGTASGTVSVKGSWSC